MTSKQDRYQRESRQRRVHGHVDRVLSHLRHAIRAQGFTQVEAQEALGWGRRYISQLLTKRKTLRVEQVVVMLNVIGVEPAAFFGEVFGFEGEPSRRRRRPRRRRVEQTEVPRELLELRSEIDALVRLLTAQGLIEVSELEAYVRSARAVSRPRLACIATER